MGLFARSLERLRLEAGFPTPYAFYHRNGGRRVFPFTFAHYLKLERGKHLPRPEWLPVLLSLLRIPPSDELYRRFVTDYLRDHFGSDEAYRSLVEPLLAPPPAAGRQQAVKRLLTEQAYHLTPAQYEAVAGDEATYWAFEVLVNDRGSFGAEDVARVTGLPKPALEAGLRRLVAHKLARRASGGKYRSPLVGRFYQFPRVLPGLDARRRRIERHIARMVARRGAVVHDSAVMIRAEAGAVRRSVGALRETLEAATADSVYSRTDSSGIYYLEVRARRAADF